MKKIQLANNKGIALISDRHFGLVSKHKWRILQEKYTAYAITAIKRGGKWTTVRMHRLIMGEPKGKDIDHRDGNGLNCQRFNLRECTNSQNMMNQRKTKGLSQYKGVCWCKRDGKWQANIAKNGKKRHLGYCSSEIEAAELYDEAARELFGKCSSLNFPKEGEQGCR